MLTRDSWETPIKLFSWFNKTLQFNLDAAASKRNALVSPYLTKKDNALEYIPKARDRIWCNPPYSLAGDFAEHFLSKNCNIVMLLPVRSDRLWFQKYLHDWRNIQVIWITGRLHFGGSGKGAFMYNVIFIRGFTQVDFPDVIGAEKFNESGNGAARS